MTLKKFLIPCNTNTVDINVYGKDDNLLYEGMLYLVFHLDDRNIEQDNYNKAYFSFEDREAVLNSEVQAWQMENDNSISIMLDY